MAHVNIILEQQVSNWNAISAHIISEEIGMGYRIKLSKLRSGLKSHYFTNKNSGKYFKSKRNKC